jgi:hypothetical protein
VSRGLGEVQQRILDCLHFGGHFGVPSRVLVGLVVFGPDGRWRARDDTPSTRASVSRALRGLMRLGYVRSFTAPSITWDDQHGTEGRRMALWNDILRRQAGKPKDRKLFALTRKGRKYIGEPAYPAQGWRVAVPEGAAEFIGFVGPIGGEHRARYDIANNVRVMRHRGPMRPRHYVLKLAAKRVANGPRDDPLG